jgi:hypothetical protein
MSLYIIVYAITWYLSTKKIQDIEKLKKLARAYLGFQMVYGLFWLCWFITGNIFVFGDSMCYEDWPVGYAIGTVILAAGYVCIVLLCCLVIMLQAALRSKSDDKEDAEVKKTKDDQDLDAKSEEKDESQVNLNTINTHDRHSKHRNPHISIPPSSDYNSQPSPRSAKPTSPKRVKEDYEARMHKMVKRLKTDLETIKSKPREKNHLDSQEIEIELQVDQSPTFAPQFRYNKK